MVGGEAGKALCHACAHLPGALPEEVGCQPLGVPGRLPLGALESQGPFCTLNGGWVRGRRFLQGTGW